MSNNRAGGGCSLILLIILGIYLAVDAYVLEPKKNDKLKKELVQKWSQKTITYFEDFSCENLEYLVKKHSITKFFVVESYFDKPCEIGRFTNTYEVFENANEISQRYTRKIEEANTIIWIHSIEGEKEGEYTDGSPARRMASEINFIDKDSKTIYYTTKVIHNGNAKNEIERYGSRNKGNDVNFGQKPYGEIFSIIKAELSN